MPSMSYCVFENTSIDMAQCVDKIQSILEECDSMDEIKEYLDNDYEFQGLRRLIDLVSQFADEVEYIEDY